MTIFHHSRMLARNVSRRLAIATALLAAVGIATPASAAEPFPTKPITILVGSPAGSLSDVLARFIAQKMGESLKQPVIVDNRPGANGSLTAGTVARAPADGYTLMLVPDTVMVVNQFVYPKLSYNTEKDFQSLALLGKIDAVLVTHPNSGLKTFADFVQQAKAKPRGLSYASGGTAHPVHLMMEMTANRLGLELTHVPYKGTAPAIQDVASGQVQVMIVGLAEAQPLMKAGRLVPLATTGPGAKDLFPNLPLLKDMNPYLDMSVWFGVFGPKGMPQEIVNKLHAEINKVLQTPEARARFAEFGMHPSATGIETLETLLKNDREKNGPLVKALGLKPE